MSCLLSLFASKDDAMEVHGAVQWLMEAHKDYRNRVVNRIISYKVFHEENLVKLGMPVILDEDASYNDLLQEAIDRDKVKHILGNRKFAEGYFTSETFSESDAIRMIAKYNAMGIEDKGGLPWQSDYLSVYPEKVKDGLARIFCEYHLLTPTISTEELVALLTTGDTLRQYSIPPTARNVDLGLVIYILVAAGALASRWPSIICCKGNLRTVKGHKMQTRNLSAAVHRFDDYKRIYLDDRQKKIERDVLNVLADVPKAINKLHK